MGKIKLSRSVFLLLHEMVLDKFQFNCEEEGYAFHKFGNYQIYGYADYARNKPNLPSSILKNQRVKAYLDKVTATRKTNKHPEVNGQYLYSRFVRMRANEYAPPVALASIYSRIYFLYLGFEDLEDFLDDDEIKAKLKPEALAVQRLLMQEDQKVALPQFLHKYGFAYYSKKLQGIYIVELSINFTPGVVAPLVSDQYPSFQVNAVEITPPLDARRKHYQGNAFYDRQALCINLEATDDKENLFAILTAQKFEDLQTAPYFEGSYVGRSRENEAISGKAFLYKVAEGKSSKEVPPLIKKRLYSRKNQIRTAPSPPSEKALAQKLERSGYGSLLDSFRNKAFKLFLLQNNGRKEHYSIQIADDYSFTIYMNPSRFLRGRIKLLAEGKTLCLERTKSKNLTKEKFYSVALLDLTNIDKQLHESASSPILLPGTFSWGNNMHGPAWTYCQMLEVPSLEIPDSHPEIKKLSHIIEEIYADLRRKRSKQHLIESESRRIKR